MGRECGVLTKPSRGLPPTRWVGESELGMLGFERLQAIRQRVVLRVGQFGRVEDVVQVLVAANLFAQRVDLLAGRGG